MSLKTHDLDPGKNQDKLPTLNPHGRGVHRRKVEAFEELPPKEQSEELRKVWKSIALATAERTKAFVTTCSPKDFGKLYQLVLASSTSIDQAFPVKEQTQSPQLIVNLFSSLGHKAVKIAVPDIPTIEVKAIDECPKEPLILTSSTQEPDGCSGLTNSTDTPLPGN